MGKIVKTGFQFLEYANSRLIRNVDDVLDLKTELITLSETKTHRELSDYALKLATHIIEISGLERTEDVKAVFSVIPQWQAKQVRFQAALEVAGRLNDLAREEKDPIKVKGYRALGQIAATPHVRWHPLVASEYTVVIINLKYPKDLNKVKEERLFQIDLMKQG